MNWHRSNKLFAILAVLILVLTALPIVGAQSPAGTDKIEPALLDSFATEGQADFVVRFAEQADLSPAYQMDWDARGEFVYTTLKTIAEKSQDQAQSYLDRHGLAHHTFIAGNELYVWTGDLAAAEALAALPEVASIRAPGIYHYDPIIETSEPASSPEAIAWGILDTQADQFWSTFGIRGNGIIVSSIDSGVEYTHDALYVNYKCQANPGSNECWEDPDNTCPGGDPCDPLGHGTHTMGTMVGDDDPGLTWNAGMAPDAQWITCNAGSPSEYALGVCGDWVLAPNGDPANRPHVVNNSWGGGGCDDWYLVRVQAWRAAGIFPAFSAGNSGSGCNSLGSPGDYQESFGSAAHDSSRNIASFSSRGPSCYGHDPYTKPNISAPGVNVCSSVPGNGWSCGYSGTSMASPHTNGAVALLWSCNPGLIGQIDQTFQILQDNTDSAPAGNCGAPPDGEGNYTYGYGYLNVYNAGLLYCGAPGYLDGYVYDDGTGAPIDGAMVAAENPSGALFTDYTDPSGYYTMTLMPATYTATASAYGYYSQTVTGVDVITAQVTTQDFSLIATPEYVVSGTVTEAGTGAPLLAQVAVLDAPVAPVTTDPATGFYSITVSEGTYTFRATAAMHMPEERVVVADQDQTQNFALDPLPCVLLVDDDGNDPDVRSFYTDALDDQGISYNIWDLDTQGDPSENDLLGHRAVMWFTGYPYGDTFNGTNEAAVAAYLDAGGNFFLSSQDYLYDFGLTPFGQDYLHIASYSSDVGQNTVTGDNLYAGLGPYSLAYPFTNYSDQVTPDGQGVVAFTGDQGDAAVAYDGGSFQSVFLGLPFEAIPNLADRSDVVAATMSFFGGCGAGGTLTGQVTHTYHGTPIEEATVTAEPSGPLSVGIQATTDPNGYYTMTLPIGTYDVTADKTDFLSQTIAGVVIETNTVTVQDLELDSAVIEVSPDNLHAYVLIGGQATMTMNIANPGGLDLWFEIAETTATMPLLGLVMQALPEYNPPSIASEAPAGDAYTDAGLQAADSIHLPAAPQRYGGPDALVYYADRGSFDADHPGLPIEGFDNTLVAPGDIVACTGPFDYLTNNACYSPGSILEGIRMQSTPTDEMVVIGTGALGNPSPIVGPNTFTDEHDITFFGEDVYAVGFDIWSPLGADSFDIFIYGPGDVLLGQTSVVAGTTGTFWGVFSDAEPITRIRTEATGASEGELFDDVAFGGVSQVIDVPWVAEYPTTTIVPAGTDFDVAVVFSSFPPYTATGDYTATLVVSHDDPVMVDDVLVPITMTVIDQPISPTAGFDSNSPVCLGEAMVFTNTSQGVPEPDYLWDFGDGVTSTVKHPTHFYGAAGSFTVTLEACNMAGCDTAMAMVEVLPQPTAGFTYDAAGLTVSFNNASQDATSYLWDFGDGGTSTETNPVYTYTAEGTYTVTLEAFNDCGSDSFVDVITVLDVPVPGFEHNAPVCLGEATVFTNTSSGADTYLWDFGDGFTSTLEHPTHTYIAAGSYTVTLEACNATTCTMAMDTVEVLPLPAANFIYTTDEFTVTFTNTSVGASSYLWDFGDGITSTLEHPVHLYATEGTYTVTLSIQGPCGTDETSQVIVVGAVTYEIYLPLITKSYTP